MRNLRFASLSRRLSQELANIQDFARTYQWFIYTGSGGVPMRTLNGAQIRLLRGSLFGVRDLGTPLPLVVLPSRGSSTGLTSEYKMNADLLDEFIRDSVKPSAYELRHILNQYDKGP